MKIVKKIIPSSIKSWIRQNLGLGQQYNHSQTKNYIDLLEIDRVPNPHYGYCILKAAEQAKILGYDSMSIIEFGVAGGKGLINIEWHISEIKKFIDLEFEVYGFDTGKGLPKPSDPRDVPYLWFEGDFVMDEELLRSRLKFAELVIGDVRDTIKSFYTKYNPAPIGCIFEDLDYFTSTLDSFLLFETGAENYLPRIPIYFDDVIGRLEFPMNEFIGELAAINEFNNINVYKKIGKINYLRYKRAMPAKWNEQIYIFQDFKHPKYSEPIRNKNPFKAMIE